MKTFAFAILAITAACATQPASAATVVTQRTVVTAPRLVHACRITIRRAWHHGRAVTIRRRVCV